ncbi:hypothetical protein [Flavobacterium maritimum]|uniref:hypothetical protein n=1 Tax=Flavobacterium maritimum TaxID=3149042 RepID=UPI0032B40004
MIIAVENQTLLDIAIKQRGTPVAALDYAIANGFSITEMLEPGQVIVQIIQEQYETSVLTDLIEKYAEKKVQTITAVKNQTLLDIAIKESGTALAAWDYAIVNGLSITDSLDPGQVIRQINQEQYETYLLTELIEKYVDQRAQTVIVIENQCLLDIAMQEDGSALAAFDWALNNRIAITDTLFPGQKTYMPKSEEFRDITNVNYFKSRKSKIATFERIPRIFEYYLPGEFPYSF